ncbi:MAG: InlB B-repeat-containing protein, partial [Atopobiaceae bacterium]|nr:InlB B-repeat-containing protein [Atopobiaceae bacterium]
LRPDGIDVKITSDSLDTTLTLTGDENWCGVIDTAGTQEESITIVPDWDRISSENDGHGQDAEGQYRYELKTPEGGNGYVITLIHTPQQNTSTSGSITWDDDDNAANMRPDSVTVHLYKNGKEQSIATVDAESDWKYDFGEKALYENGNKIAYEVEQNEIFDGDNKLYNTTVDGFDILNSYVGQKDVVSVTGVTQWIDGSNEYERRPQSVKLTLLANGEEVNSQKLKLQGVDVWPWSFDNLHENDAEGNEISYSVVPEDVDGYEVTCTSIVNGASDDSAETSGNAGEQSSTQFLVTYTMIVSDSEKTPAKVTVAPDPLSLSYTGEEQVLVKKGEVEGGTMVYALGTDATTPPADDAYSTEMPTGTDAGTYYVWYKAQGDILHTDSEPACVTATIADVTYSLTVYTRSQDSSDPICDATIPAGPYRHGSSVTVSVPDVDGYAFVGWYELTEADSSGHAISYDNRLLSADLSYTFDILEDTQLVAVFKWVYDPEHHVHSLSHVKAKTATCLEDGNIEYWVCDQGDTPCGKYFSDSEGKTQIAQKDTVIDAIGHNWSDWTVISNPSCIAEGKMTRVCANNNSHVETEVTPIDTDAHDWGEWKVTKQATDTEEGVERRTCANDASHVQNRSIPKKDPQAAVYVVKQGLDGSWTKPQQSTSDAVASYTPESIEGFTMSGYSVDFTEDEDARTVTEPGTAINLQAGKSTLYVYYARNAYDLVFYDDIAGTTVAKTEKVPYGTALSTYKDVKVQKDDHTFAGWSLTPRTSGTYNYNETIPDNSPTKSEENRQKYPYVLYGFGDTMPASTFSLYPVLVRDRLEVHLDLGSYDQVAVDAGYEWYDATKYGADAYRNTPAYMKEAGSDGKPQARQFTVNVNEKLRMEAMNAATRDGYELDGWYTQGHVKWDASWGMTPEYMDKDENGNTIMHVAEGKNYTYGIVTITAGWTPKVIDALFHKGNYGKADVTSVKTSLGSTLTLPSAPEVTDGEYYFTGWRDSKGTLHGAGEELLFEDWSLTTDEVLEFTAQYAKRTHHLVIFDSAGGSSVPTVDAAEGTKVDNPTDPTKNGYTFDGWYLGSTKVSFPVTVGNADVTYTAHWKANEYTITFDASGGSEVASVTAAYGTDISARKPKDPTREHYAFAGWTPEFPSTMPAGDVTLKASWTPMSYTVTFDANGGTLVDDDGMACETITIEDIYDASIAVPANPTRSGNEFEGGYVFEGWTLEGSDELVAFPSHMPDTNPTYKAKWHAHVLDDPYGEVIVSATCETPGSYDVVTCCITCGKEIYRVHKTQKAYGHQWDGGQVTQEPTCTDEGTLVYTCQIDRSHKRTLVIEPIGHEWGPWVVTQAPTCTAEGEQMRVCSRDASHKEFLPVDIDPDAHDWGEWVEVKAATESTPGLEQRTCKYDANHVEARAIPQLDHVHGLTKVPAKDPTCTDDGNIEHWQCTDGDSPCGRLYSDKLGTDELSASDVVVKATGHAWGKPTYTWSADNTTVTAMRVCANDSTHVQTEIAETTAAVTKEPTCTAAGEMTYTATFKNADFQKQSKAVALAPTGHDWGEWAETTPAGCTEDGVETRVCANDTEHTETRSIPALGHKWKELRWSTDDTMHVKRTCERCGEVDEYSYDLDHEHEMAWSPEREATCEEPGSIEYYLCMECLNLYADRLGEHQISEADIVIPALGHDWGEPTYTWSEDCSTVTAARACKRDASHTQTETVSTFAQTEAPTCTKEGSATYTAVFENEAFKAQTKTVAVPATGHKPSAQVVRENVVAPTCTKNGTYDSVTYCSVCGDEITRVHETTNALGHDWGEWEETRAATDTAEGEETRVCKNNASHKETRAIPVLSHTHQWDEGVVTTEPTCTSEGVRTFTCKLDATHTKTESIARLEHSYEWFEESYAEPTCEADGYHWRVKRCTVCGEAASKLLVKDPALGHDWGEVAYVWSTDNSTVTATRTCQRDSRHTESETATATAKVAKKPTCTESGSTTYTAVFENEAFTAQKKVVETPATGHSLGQMTRENEVAATCTETGSYDNVIRCGTCGVELSRTHEIIAATGHDWGEWTVTKAATETEEGEEQRVCANDAKHVEKRAIAKIGHTHQWDEGVVTTEPTCTVDGVRTFTCKLDSSHTKTETIPATGHKFVWEEHSVLAPTCDTVGYTLNVKRCTVCDESDEGEIIWEFALGHDWGAASYVWSEDNATVTATHTCLRDSSHVESVTVKTVARTTDATCTDKGSITYTATFGDASFEDQEKVVETPAKGHTPGQAVRENVVQPTCDDAGSYDSVTYCQACGAELKRTHETLNALGHDWGEWKVTKAATNTSAGEETRTCTRDASHKQTRSIPASGHEHVWDEGRVTIEPTCTSEGEKLYTCKVDGCDQTKTEEIDRLAHDGVWQDEVITKPTCDSDGYHWHIYRCATCGEVMSRIQVKDAALGHDWGAWTQSKAATCTDTGEEQRICSRDRTHVETRTTEALGHDWDEPTYTWSEDNSEVTAERSCKRCHAITESETVKTTVSTTEATCLEPGTTTYTATFEDEAFETQEKGVGITATGHAWGDWQVIREATKTEEGEEQRVCANEPTHVEKRTIPVKDSTKGTLTFDLAGGMLNGSTEALVISADIGDTITIPDAPTREGYTFQYWKGSEYYPGDAYKVEGDHSFTAQWKQNDEPTPEPVTYTISFNANGGTGTMSKLTVEEGDKVTLTANAFARSGYTFSGWNTAKDGKGTAYSDKAEVEPKADMMLYAQWVKKDSG